MRLEIMLKHVPERTSSMEMQRVFTSGNFALDSASLVKLAINTSKQCPKSVKDFVATHSSRHKKLASMTNANLSMEHLVALTRRSIIYEGWFSL